MTLDEARALIGEKVTYQANGAPEEGVITSVNNLFVFVRYGADTGSKATSPQMLKAPAPCGCGHPPHARRCPKWRRYPEVLEARQCGCGMLQP